MATKQPIIYNKTGQDVSGVWEQELRKTIEASYHVLEQLEKSGYPYKRISSIVLEDTTVPYWVGESEENGRVHLDPFKHDARAIAHEIGHGFEERWRKRASEVMGQSLAEAIRFFVEKKMGNAQWTPRNEWRIVINMCSGDLERFKELLGGKDLHKKYCEEDR